MSGDSGVSVGLSRLAEKEKNRKPAEELCGRTKSPCQNVRNGEENAGSCQVDGKVSDSNGGGRCKNNLANTPYKGRDDQDQAPLLRPVCDKSRNIGEEIRGEVWWSCKALGVDAAVSHLGHNGGEVDWQARVAHVDAEIHALRKRSVLLVLERKKKEMGEKDVWNEAHCYIQHNTLLSHHKVFEKAA